MVSNSIVIATYNQKQTLGQVLNGLAEQIRNPKSFEVVVTDDASTDGTEQFIKRMRYPIFMKYVRAAVNAGRSENRNRGYAKTVGGHVLFLDGDMLPGPKLVDTHMAAWEKYPDEVIVGSILVPPELKSDRVLAYLCSRGRLRRGKESVIPGRYFTSGNFSTSRAIFDKLGGFDVSMRGWGGEDTDFGIRLDKAGMKMRYFPEAGSYHRHPKSIEDEMKNIEEYGASGYRRLIEKHPESVIFPRGWVLGLPDSKPGLSKRMLAGLLSPLRSAPAISILKFLSRLRLGGNLALDWLLYGALARGYDKGKR